MLWEEVLLAWKHDLYSPCSESEMEIQEPEEMKEMKEGTKRLSSLER